MKTNAITERIMKRRYTRQRDGFLRRITLAGLLVWILLLPVVVLSAPAAASYRSDRILIKPKAEVSLNDLAELHAYLGNQVLQTFPRMGNWQVLRIPRGVAVPNALKAYKLSGFVQFAEPDYILHISMEPDDLHYQNGDQWNLKNLGQYGGSPGADIDATNGWDIRTSASNIIVAVIDTGVRYTHEDLAPNMWHNPQENQDGYTNDLYGINLVNNGRGDGDPWDDYGHGTHVAGIIGAAGNNGEGIAGVCWDARLMALKFIDATGNGSVSDAITCINYAASHGAKIINASWGSYDFTSAALWDSINTIRDEGIIFVAAAGNDANNNDAYSLYPATYCESLDNVIAVAATDRNDALAPWSNYGLNSVQIAAPGDPVFSCWNGSDSDYQYYQGTSMAAPQVAGACALVWAQFPKLTALQVMKRVLNGVDSVPGLADKCGTGGRLNLFKALTPQVISKTPPPATNVWVDDSLPDGAESTSTTVTNYDANGNVEWIEEPWNWIAGNPAPFSGAAADQSASFTGIHRQSFENATNTLTIYSGDDLFAYVYLDPTNPPSEIMIEWNDGCWEHRAFWGEDDIPWGQYGTSDRLDMGDLPPAGQWVRLEVPASALKLEGAALQGMSFVLYNGAATWDAAGRVSAGSSQ